MTSFDMNRIRIQHNMGKEPQALPTAEEWAEMQAQLKDLDLRVRILTRAVNDLLSDCHQLPTTDESND